MLKPRKYVCEMQEYESYLYSCPIDLRLDMNENTSGCSPRVLAKIHSLDEKVIALYPFRELGEQAVAEFLGIRTDELILTNGADECIDLMCRGYLEAEREIIIVVPAFTMYEIFAQSTGARIVKAPTEPDYSFPIERVLQAITPQTRLIILTNPNNPTGLPMHRSEILRILQAAPDAAVLVDEAYFDFYGQTVMDQIGKIPNLFITRTFSKAYGLAGIRLGLLAGPAEQMSVLRRVISPFNVNVLAMECLKEALDDRQFVAGYVAQVRSTREWLRRELETMGVKCWPSETNFVLAYFGDLRPHILAAMSARGIALRNRPDCEGCIRIGIGSQAEMEKVISELKQILAEKQAMQQVAG